MKKLVCEFVGTMMLVLLACGVAVATEVHYLGTALAFGLVVIAMSYAIGSVSGCHINPAVSLGMALTKRISWFDFFEYVIAQILGAITGAAILGVILQDYSALGANTYNGTGTTVWIALLVEIILTFVFVLTVLEVTEKKENGHATGIIIGLTLTLVHLFGIPFTGTSVNPARSIGPALLQGGLAINQLWVFILAPLVGAMLASLFYRYIKK